MTLSSYRHDTHMLDIAKERNFIGTSAFVSVLLFILFLLYICNEKVEIKYV